MYQLLKPWIALSLIFTIFTGCAATGISGKTTLPETPAEDAPKETSINIGGSPYEVREVREEPNGEVVVKMRMTEPKRIFQSPELQQALLSALNKKTQEAFQAKFAKEGPLFTRSEDFDLTVPEPTTQQAHAPAAPVQELADTSSTQYLVRYSCCNQLPILSEPSGFIVQTQVNAGQMLHVVDLYPGGLSLKGKLKLANSNTTLLDLLNPTKEIYFAKVRVPNTQVEGWVPLYSLLMDEPKIKSDVIQATGTFGLFARIANRGVAGTSFSGFEGIFNPEDCDETNHSIRVPYTEDMFLHDKWRPCSDPLVANDCNFCYDVYEDWDYYQNVTCTAVEEPFIPEVGNCKKYCDYALKKYNPAHPDTYPVRNPVDYQCGEYPIGETHYQNSDAPAVVNLQDKRLYAGSLWGKHIYAKMKRAQKQVVFDIKNLTSGAVEEIDAGHQIDGKNFWFNMNIKNPDAEHPNGVQEIRACAYLPGTKVWGKNVEFDPKDTPGHAFKRINFGSADLGSFKVCAEAEVTLDNQWRPQLTWTHLDVPEFDYINIDDLEVTFANWVYVVGAAAAVAAPALMGFIGTIIDLILIEVLALPSVVLGVINNTSNDVWMVNNPFTTGILQTYLNSDVLDKINTVTSQSVNQAVPNFRGQFGAACNAVCGGGVPPVGNPFRPFCSGCFNMANDPNLVSFHRDPGSEARGCYAQDAYFTPHGKFDLNNSPWWNDFGGTGWVTGNYDQDRGCHIPLRMETAMEQHSWLLAKCVAHQANGSLNAEKNDLMTRIQNNCKDTGRDMLRHYYGSGEDVKALFETLYPSYENTLTMNTGGADTPEPYEQLATQEAPIPHGILEGLSGPSKRFVSANE